MSSETRWETIRREAALVTESTDGADLLAAVLFAANADIDRSLLRDCIETLNATAYEESIVAGKFEPENKRAMSDSMSLLWGRDSRGALEASLRIDALESEPFALVLNDARKGVWAFEWAKRYDTNLIVGSEWVRARLHASRGVESYVVGQSDVVIGTLAACILAATDDEGRLDARLLRELVVSDDLAAPLDIIEKKQSTSPIAVLVLEVHDRLSPDRQRVIAEGVRSAAERITSDSTASA